MGCWAGLPIFPPAKGWKMFLSLSSHPISEKFGGSLFFFPPLPCCIAAVAIYRRRRRRRRRWSTMASTSSSSSFPYIFHIPFFFLFWATIPLRRRRNTWNGREGYRQKITFNIQDMPVADFFFRIKTFVLKIWRNFLRAYPSLPFWLHIIKPTSGSEWEEGEKENGGGGGRDPIAGIKCTIVQFRQRIPTQPFFPFLRGKIFRMAALAAAPPTMQQKDRKGGGTETESIKYFYANVSSSSSSSLLCS